MRDPGHIIDGPAPIDLKAATAYPRKARVIFDFMENGEQVHQVMEGWAHLDGQWLHFFPEDHNRWQSWPVAHVLCVEWDRAT